METEVELQSQSATKVGNRLIFSQGLAHSCPSCGVLGSRRRRRARLAAEVADVALVAFFVKLNAERTR